MSKFIQIPSREDIRLAVRRECRLELKKCYDEISFLWNKNRLLEQRIKILEGRK